MEDAPFLDGWFAHKEKQGMTDPRNPFNRRSQPYSWMRWQIGYSSRYDAIKQGLPLEHDDRMWSR